MKKLLAIFLVLMLAGFGALAEGATLTVQGAGLVDVDANRATISVGVREVAVEVAAAQAAVNEKIETVINALADAGVDRSQISTNYINIYPNYDYSGPVEEIVSYSASNILLVTVDDPENIGKVIDAAFDAGANTLDYVEFAAADTADASRQALELAVANAMDKGQLLAGAAGKRLGGIVEIKEGAASEYDLPVMYAKTEDAGAGTQVIASKQKVAASVTVVFELLDAE